jgi:hypothetical protein
MRGEFEPESASEGDRYPAGGRHGAAGEMDAETDVIEPHAVGWLVHRLAGDLLGDFFDPGGAELERAVIE